jgi:hypothetical protein
MSTATMKNLYRVCVKLYGPEPRGLVGGDAATFVPILHEWFREDSLGLVMIDVADYAHAPDSPGIMLVTYETSFALDRSDGEFGLLAQRRTRFDGDAEAAVAETIRQALMVADKLESDHRLGGKVQFDRSRIRVEANDRLLAPNTDEGYTEFSAVVQAAVAELYPGRTFEVSRVQNDPRDRLAVLVA